MNLAKPIRSWRIARMYMRPFLLNSVTGPYYAAPKIYAWLWWNFCWGRFELKQD